MRPKKITDPEANAKILDAAMYYFNRNGYATTRTSEIAVMGATSETAIFRMFQSKSGLANACLSTCLESQYLIRTDHIDLTMPSRQLFRKICETHMNFYLRTPERYMFTLVTSHHDFIDEDNKLQMQQWRLNSFNVVRLLMNSGKLKEQSIEMTLSIFFGSFIRLAQNAFAGHITITSREVEAMASILWESLGKEDE
jgi:AcrR family transcriptional regulator